MVDTAKVFMSGRSQAVRLPKAYRVDAVEMTIERAGDALVLRPVRADALARFLEHRDAHIAAHRDDRFPDRDQPRWGEDDAVDKAFR
jgi:antitoxin VapB